MADLAAKFLLVEDDDETRALVESILGFEGHTVVSTANPAAALGLARAEQPDLVLCDITMPVMDGYGVLKALQSDPATAARPGRVPLGPQGLLASACAPSASA